MARYDTTVTSSKTPEEAFRYMADLRNFADWDHAILTANWIVAPMNLVLGAVFKKVGDSATKGLRKVLA